MDAGNFIFTSVTLVKFDVPSHFWDFLEDPVEITSVYAGKFCGKVHDSPYAGKILLSRCYVCMYESPPHLQILSRISYAYTTAIFSCVLFHF